MNNENCAKKETALTANQGGDHELGSAKRANEEACAPLIIALLQKARNDFDMQEYHYV